MPRVRVHRLAVLAALHGLPACGASEPDPRLGTLVQAFEPGAPFLLSPLGPRPSAAHAAGTAFGAGRFLVAADDGVRRIDGTGLLDHPAIAFVPGAPWTDVAFDGADFVVLGALYGVSSPRLTRAGQITVRRVRPDGTSPGELVVADLGPVNIPSASIACGPGHCLAVWSAAEVSSALVVDGPGDAGSVATLTGTPAGQVAVAFDGSRYVVVALRPDTPAYHVDAFIVDETGALAGSAPSVFTIPGVAGVGGPTDIAIAAAAGGFLAVTSEPAATGEALVVRRLAPDLQLVGDPFTLDRATRTSARVAAGAGGYLVVWTACDGPDCTGRSAWVPSSGESPVPREHGAGTLQAPTVAHGDGGFFTTWSTAPDQVLLGRRFDAAGAPVGEPMVLANDTPRQERFPTAAWDGCSFVTVWKDWDRLTGIRVNGRGEPVSDAFTSPEFGSLAPDDPLVVAARDGRVAVAAYVDSRVRVQRFGEDDAPVDSASVELGHSTSNPARFALAGTATGWLAVWDAMSASGTPAVITGSLATLDGPWLEGRTLSSTSSLRVDGQLGTNGEGYLVAWTDLRAGFQIYGAILDGEAEPIGPELLIGGSGVAAEKAAIGSDGAGYLVLWQEQEQGGNAPRILARSVSATGVLGPPASVVTERGILSYAQEPVFRGGANAHVVFDGTSYVVAWYDPGTGEHHLTHLDRVGRPVEPWETLLSARPTGLASDGRGRTLVTYQADDDRAYGLIFTGDRAPPLADCGSLEGGVPDAAPVDAAAPDAAAVDAALPPATDASTDGSIAGHGARKRAAGDAGCSCRVGRTESGASAWLAAFGVALVSAARRRRYLSRPAAVAAESRLGHALRMGADHPLRDELGFLREQALALSRPFPGATVLGRCYRGPSAPGEPAGGHRRRRGSSRPVSTSAGGSSWERPRSRRR